MDFLISKTATMRGIIAPLVLAMTTATAFALNPVADPDATVVAGNARFTVLTDEMIRIEYSDKGEFEDRATFTVQNREMDDVPQFTQSEDDRYLYITTGKLRLKYRKGSNPRTLPASPENLTVTMTHNGREVLWYPGKPDPLNLKGTCRTLDGSNGDNKRREMENGLISRSGWAVIDDSWTAARPDGSRSFPLEYDATVGYDWWSARKDPHATDLYFMGYGSDYKKAIGDFTRIAGRIPLPPDYVFGYWYSKYASYSADDYRSIMNDLASNDIPADVMILDMDWHWNGDGGSQSAGIGGWTGWSWNTNLIPEPEKLLGEIHDRNFRVALNLHPADGINSVESPGYFSAMDSELGGRYTDNGTIAWNLDFPDFTKSFFSNIIRDHEREGVDFWWLDWQQHLTSPYTSGLGQTFWCNHVFYNDMKKNRPDRRPVIFHRWGGLGSHRYQIGFSGDALINFPTLAFQPYFTATASNVGYAYWGHDLGGHAFTDEATVNNPELVLRWIQFGVFTPIFRTHATKDDRIERRIWKFSNFPLMRDAVRLRYTLFPYIYTMARATYDTGIGMCRPMYYEYPEAEEAYAYEGQYFFGDDILVAPVTEAGAGGSAAKEIWFPEGEWWSASTGELIEGPCVRTMHFTDAQIPYFYRAGSVVPLNPASVKNVTERPAEIVLNIIGGADGTGSLYEDAGDNSDYDTDFATTSFAHTVDGLTETYTVNPRVNGAGADVSALRATRAWTMKIHNVTAPVSVTLNGNPVDRSTWEFDGGVLTVKVPESPVTSKNEVKVVYSGEVALHRVAEDRAALAYDRSTGALTAVFGTSRSEVDLSVCSLAGVECLSRRYNDVAFVSENLSRLSPAVYICRVKADNETLISKITR